MTPNTLYRDASGRVLAERTTIDRASRARVTPLKGPLTYAEIRERVMRGAVSDQAASTALSICFLPKPPRP